MVHALEDEYWGRLRFAYLDVDDARNQLTLETLGFRYQPEFYLVDGQGNILQQWIGNIDPAQLRPVFDGVIASN